VTEQKRLAAALEYQQAQQPARINPNLAAQGEKSRNRLATALASPSWSGEELPMENRATFLPFRDTMPGSVMNKRELALPGVLAGAVNAITAPARSMETYTDDYGEVRSKFNAPQEAANVALNMMGGGMSASRNAPANALGMFVGPRSKSWNAEANARAVQMEKAGATPETIWQETGNYKAPDAAWRQEIPDNLATLRGAGKFENVIMNAYDRGVKATKGQREFYQPYTTTVGDVLSHGILQEAYPKLMSIETQMTPKGSGNRGMLSIDDVGKQILHVNENLPAKQAESTMLHELQHAIQEKENFGRGGSSELVVREANAEAEKIAKKLNEMKYGSQEYEKLYEQFVNARKNITVDQANDMYRRLAGEAEARATQKRQNLTSQQRRAEFPERSYDVPINELIIRR
tara:strand:- start:321 stop:1535 length:1215 start_codon:yes stop_codon:yes gene_type:complete